MALPLAEHHQAETDMAETVDEPCLVAGPGCSGEIADGYRRGLREVRAGAPTRSRISCRATIRARKEAAMRAAR
jgi:hypothetical protein